MGTKLTKEEFLERANKAHNSRYIYNDLSFSRVHDKIAITCKIHGPFKQKVYSHLNGQGCPECGRYSSKRMLSRDEALKRVYDRYGSTFDMSYFEYNGTQEKSKVICNACGNEFLSTINTLCNPKRVYGCPTCARKNSAQKISEAKKKDIAYFIARAKEVHGDLYDYSKSQYRGAFDPITITCKIHGDFETRTSSHLDGAGCSKCSSERISKALSRTINQFVAKSVSQYGDAFDYSKVQSARDIDQIEIKCKKHDLWFTTVVGAHLSKNKAGLGGCPACRKEARLSVTPEKEFLRRAHALYGSLYSYENYSALSEKVTILCDKHGKVEQLAYVHLRGGGCPSCSVEDSFVTSKEETEVIKFLSYFCSVKKGGRDLITPFEIDIHVPEAAVAIEYNGLFWHTEDKGRGRYYHLSKTKACAEKGIRLIHLFSDEWKYKQPLVKTLLKSAILKTARTVFARNCEVVEISSSLSNKFYDIHHLQGGTKSGGLSLCLVNEGNIVSCLTIATPRFSANYDFELIRFANQAGTKVVGGLERLLEHARRRGLSGTLISYCDKRWFTGTSYKRAGFSLVRETEPGFCYTKGIRRINRIAMQKHKLPEILATYDNSLSAAENLKRERWEKIYDCGDYVFSITL